MRALTKIWAAVFILGVGSAPAFGQMPEGLIGLRVITRYGTVLKNGPGGEDIKPQQPGAEVLREAFAVYRLKSARGRWLELIAEEDGNVGWARVENVIPYDRAIDYFNGEIRDHPASELFNSRGNIWRDRGEFDKAIADFNEAIRLDAANEAAYSNRGNAWSDKGELDKAIADFNEAIRLDPKFASAYHNRGAAWLSKEDYGKALADFDTAIQLAPSSAQAYNSRAWLLATCPNDTFRDGKRAVELAARACELTHYRNIALIDTLAAAYAEAGDFEQGAQWQEAALGMLPQRAEAIRKDFGQRLDLYRNKKPYREEPKPTSRQPGPGSRS